MAEVDKAKTFTDKLDEFWILTSAKATRTTQDKLRSINAAHKKLGIFSVHLLTWEGIERLLSDCPTAQATLGVVPTLSPSAAGNELSLARSASNASSDLGADFAEIQQHLDVGDVMAATLLLNRLRARQWDVMPSPRRARLCALLADTHLRRGEREPAARLLVECRQHDPTEERAIVNEIVGTDLLGDKPQAQALAALALAAMPRAPRVYGAALRTATTRSDFEQLLLKCPAELRTSLEVVMACATREDIGSEAATEVFARAAVAAFPDDFRGWMALGTQLLNVELAKLSPESPPTRRAVDVARLKEALPAFRRAADLARREGRVAAQVHVLQALATAHSCIDDNEVALSVLEEAWGVEPTNSATLFAIAQAQMLLGRHSQAIASLRELVMRDPSDGTSFTLGTALWNRASEGDRAEATELFVRVARTGGAHPEWANFLAVDGLVQQQSHARALAHISETEGMVGGCVAAVLRGRIELARGDTVTAGQWATQGLATVDSNASVGLLRALARGCPEKFRDHFDLIQRPLAEIVEG